MSLGPGQRLGPYEVVGALGAGGMGQVFRARDTRLGREVALKVLPDELAGNAERRSRLEHEAKLLASLNHPRIAALYDVLDFEGSPVLVMEVVEGETLFERLSRGPLPLKLALEVALPIAEALEAAHERGILHRDLKPSNVKLTPQGDVKVLDFGLAKALEPEEGDVGSAAATLPKLMEKTESGVAVGTAPYMSPEQARGEAVNKRTDVWAFGCILFEMLTGRRAFAGATRADAIAAVLGREPDWGSLPSSTPAAVRRILKRCLQKEQKERLRDIVDVKLELKDLLLEGTGNAPPRRWKASVIAGGALALLAATGILMLLRRQPVPRAEIRQPRTQLTLPRGVDLNFSTASTLAISPDGRRVVFRGCASAGCQLYLRDRLELDAQPLPSTEDGVGPFFSPDGRWVAFGAKGELRKIALERGTVVTLADALALRGGSWGEDGTILFSGGRGGLLRVSAEGGAVEEVTKLDPGEYDHRWPQILPGGRAVLFEVVHDEAAGQSSGSRGHEIAIADLDKGTRRTLIERAGCPKYVDGHMLFGRDGTVNAAPFDLKRLEPSRPPSPVLEGVAMWSTPSFRNIASGVVSYDVARDGTLLYAPRDSRLPKRTLVSFDREGRPKVLSPSERAYYNPRLSPDGRRIAVTVQTDVDAKEVFIFDIGSGAWTRVNVDGEASSQGSERPHFYAAAWLPDGDRVLLAADWYRNAGMLLVRVDESKPPVTFPFDISPTGATVAPDGSDVLVPMQRRPSQWDIWRIALEGDAEPWLATEADEDNPSFSPDGRWVAYESTDSGDTEVYVRPYTGSNVRYQVTTEGGGDPRWSRSGSEIFFRGGGRLWSTRVRTSSTFTAEPPQKLFDLADDVKGELYDVFPDGQRFLMVQKDPLELRPLDLVVIPGWVEEMKARLKAK